MSRVRSMICTGVLAAATAAPAQATPVVVLVQQWNSAGSLLQADEVIVEGDAFYVPAATDLTFVNQSTEEVEFGQGQSTGSGNYRLCTDVSSFANQVDPLGFVDIQRGGQDDCVRFRVKRNP